VTHRVALAIAGLTPLIAAAFISASLLLTPLPTMNQLGSPIGWCGPGATSDNAIQVLLDPNAVNEAGGTVQSSDYAAQMALRSYCVGEARTRFIQSGLSVAAGTIVGLGLCAIISLTGFRRSPNAIAQPAIYGFYPGLDGRRVPLSYHRYHTSTPTHTTPPHHNQALR
jgi:hypothetical protein